MPGCSVGVCVCLCQLLLWLLFIFCCYLLPRRKTSASHTHTHTHTCLLLWCLTTIERKKHYCITTHFRCFPLNWKKNAQFLYFFCCFLSIYMRARVCVCLLVCLCMYILNISLIISVSLRRRIIILHAHREACKYSHRFFFAIRFKCV